MYKQIMILLSLILVVFPLHSNASSLKNANFEYNNVEGKYVNSNIVSNYIYVAMNGTTYIGENGKYKKLETTYYLTSTIILKSTIFTSYNGGFYHYKSTIDKQIENVNNVSNCEVYPTPLTNIANIQFESTSKDKCKIFAVDINSSKTLIWEGSVETGLNELQIGIERIQSGVVFFLIQTTDRQYTGRNIIVR